MVMYLCFGIFIVVVGILLDVVALTTIKNENGHKWKKDHSKHTVLEEITQDTKRTDGFHENLGCISILCICRESDSAEMSYGDSTDHDKNGIKCERSDWSISLVHWIEMDAEETKTELEETKDNTEKEIERKETVSYCTKESPSIVHSDEHTVEEQDLRGDDKVEDDMDNPSDAENSSQDTKDELYPTHNDRTTRVCVKQLELLVTVVDDVHGSAPLVVILTSSASFAAFSTPAGIAELLAPLDELDGLVVDDGLLLVVSALAQSVRTGDETPEEIVGDGGETDAAEDDHDEVTNKVDDGNDEEHGAHTEGHVARTRAARFRAALVLGFLIFREFPRVETDDRHLSDAKEDVGHCANRGEDTDDDEDGDGGCQGALDGANRTATLEVSDVALVPEEEEGEHDDGEHADEDVHGHPDLGHGQAAIYCGVGDIEGEQQNAALTDDEPDRQNDFCRDRVGRLELVLVVNDNQCIDDRHDDGRNAHDDYEYYVYHSVFLLALSSSHCL